MMFRGVERRVLYGRFSDISEETYQVISVIMGQSQKTHFLDLFSYGIPLLIVFLLLDNNGVCNFDYRY